MVAVNHDAGAILRFRPDLPTYGGQNSLWDLGAHLAARRPPW